MATREGVTFKPLYFAWECKCEGGGTSLGLGRGGIAFGPAPLARGAGPVGAGASRARGLPDENPSGSQPAGV